MACAQLTATRIDQTLDAVYRWSRARSYCGHTKHDALNSPLLRGVLGWNKWTRIIAIQGVMRFPFNIRPLLLVRKTQNPKGLGLFVMGLLDRYRSTQRQGYLDQARQILGLLQQLRAAGQWHGNCWGYPYPWQDLGFFAPANTPNAVVTCFVCEAYLDTYRITRDNQYLEVVRSAIQFLLADLAVLKDSEDELCLGYMPLPMHMRVMDVSILIGSLLAQYSAETGDPSHQHTAWRLLNYVVRQQTDYGAWFYTDPPGDSPIRHDNYHTGFILDALWKFMHATGDMTWMVQYRKGLQFYADRLFNPDGSPRWTSDQDYPHDIHGAAQGIITFARHHHEYPGLAERIATWGLETMYHFDGRFYYQQSRFWKTRFTLMRWCNAWMARALAHLRLHMAYVKS